jgi:hypothetical protein
VELFFVQAMFQWQPQALGLPMQRGAGDSLFTEPLLLAGLANTESCIVFFPLPHFGHFTCVSDDSTIAS